MGVVTAAIVNLTENVTLPAGQGHELLDVTYRLLAAPGPSESIVSRACFCETLKSAPNTPPSRVIVTIDLTTYDPARRCANVLIEGSE